MFHSDWTRCSEENNNDSVLKNMVSSDENEKSCNTLFKAAVEKKAVVLFAVSPPKTGRVMSDSKESMNSEPHARNVTKVDKEKIPMSTGLVDKVMGSKESN